MRFKVVLIFFLILLSLQVSASTCYMSLTLKDQKLASNDKFWADFEKDLKTHNIDKQIVFDLAIQINHPDIIDFIKTYQEYMSIKASLPQNDNINNSKKIKLYAEKKFVRAVNGGTGEAKAAGNYAAAI